MDALEHEISTGSDFRDLVVHALEEGRRWRRAKRKAGEFVGRHAQGLAALGLGAAGAAYLARRHRRHPETAEWDL